MLEEIKRAKEKFPNTITLDIVEENQDILINKLIAFFPKLKKADEYTYFLKTTENLNFFSEKAIFGVYGFHMIDEINNFRSKNLEFAEIALIRYEKNFKRISLTFFMNLNPDVSSIFYVMKSEKVNNVITRSDYTPFINSFTELISMMIEWVQNGPDEKFIKEKFKTQHI